MAMSGTDLVTMTLVIKILCQAVSGEAPPGLEEGGEQQQPSPTEV